MLYQVSVSAILRVFLIFVTKSSANITLDTVSSPTVTPCSAASTATIMSSIHTLNRLGDSVHPCAAPCKILYQQTWLPGISPSSITALVAHSVIFLIILHIFPLILISHISGGGGGGGQGGQGWADSPACQNTASPGSSGGSLTSASRIG